MKLFKKFLLLVLISILFQSCGTFKKSNVKDNPINDADKRKKNIEEGRGITLGKGSKGSNTFDFATSNEMWRASLEILDFVPLSTVDYSGGIIITDWYSSPSKPYERYKITILIKSSSLRADALKVSFFKLNLSFNLGIDI